MEIQLHETVGLYAERGTGERAFLPLLYAHALPLSRPTQKGVRQTMIMCKTPIPKALWKSKLHASFGELWLDEIQVCASLDFYTHKSTSSWPARSSPAAVVKPV